MLTAPDGRARRADHAETCAERSTRSDREPGTYRSVTADDGHDLWSAWVCCHALRQNDVVVGTPVATRQRREVETLASRKPSNGSFDARARRQGMESKSASPRLLPDQRGQPWRLRATGDRSKEGGVQRAQTKAKARSSRHAASTNADVSTGRTPRSAAGVELAQAKRRHPEQ